MRNREEKRGKKTKQKQQWNNMGKKRRESEDEVIQEQERDTAENYITREGEEYGLFKHCVCELCCLELF